MPQKGNPKPRVFKIPEYEAIIQRLGFNNCGIEIFLENLKKMKTILLVLILGKIKVPQHLYLIINFSMSWFNHIQIM